MNFTGILIGAITFLIIGIFHPIVIWAEFHFSKKIWPIFAVVGLVFLIMSLIADKVVVSCIFSVIAASCFWSIHELYQQEKRVEKGWFPKNPKRDRKGCKL